MSRYFVVVALLACASCATRSAAGACHGDLLPYRCPARPDGDTGDADRGGQPSLMPVQTRRDHRRGVPRRRYAPQPALPRLSASLPPATCRHEPAGPDLIHGLQLTDSQWDDLGVDETADRLIWSGALPPVVIVMPWERKGLDFETAVAEKLLPHIRATYAGDGGRELTAIGGLSCGAGWALRIGLQHPDLFGAIGLHSPAILPPDMYYMKDWIDAAREDSRVPRFWIDIAERDTSRAGAEELAKLLDDLGVTYAWSRSPESIRPPTGRLECRTTFAGMAWPGNPAAGRWQQPHLEMKAAPMTLLKDLQRGFRGGECCRKYRFPG